MDKQSEDEHREMGLIFGVMTKQTNGEEGVLNLIKPIYNNQNKN